MRAARRASITYGYSFYYIRLQPAMSDSSASRLATKPLSLVRVRVRVRAKVRARARVP